MKKFKHELLEIHLPERFKGLRKDYLIGCIFDDEIQQRWVPGVGDIIVTNMGRIYVISAKENFDERIGGTMYYYGGGACNRDGGHVLDSTFCYTANESGKYYHPIKGEVENLYHTSIRNFRYVPYPHERW